MSKFHLAALTLGLFLSVDAQAQPPAEPTADEHGSASNAQEKQPQEADREKPSTERPTNTLDGDQVLEGQPGDSTDQENPGGAHGDGQTDPGMLE
ncbi:hypothetical protein [Pseudomonas sp. SO81]|uniref:hypothetical protein n=1 Tax=Pseudomonas sp. SO81 TaxID=2983246 RepID=UPI0025A43EF6|nr:hypothetical protein [Pseudomonas sp. SO81]